MSTYSILFFFYATATTEIYTLTLSFPTRRSSDLTAARPGDQAVGDDVVPCAGDDHDAQPARVDAPRLGGPLAAHAPAPSFICLSASARSSSAMRCPMRSRLVSRYW